MTNYVLVSPDVKVDSCFLNKKKGRSSASSSTLFLTSLFIVKGDREKEGRLNDEKEEDLIKRGRGTHRPPPPSPRRLLFLYFFRID